MNQWRTCTEQLTEWHHPNDAVEVVVQGAQRPGRRPVTRNVTFLDWANGEADRMHGMLRRRGDLIAVFVPEK